MKSFKILATILVTVLVIIMLPVFYTNPWNPSSNEIFVIIFLFFVAILGGSLTLSMGYDLLTDTSETATPDYKWRGTVLSLHGGVLIACALFLHVFVMGHNVYREGSSADAINFVAENKCTCAADEIAKDSTLVVVTWTPADEKEDGPHMGYTIPAVKGAIIVRKGGSLCGTLHMTPKQALLFAKRTERTHYWKNNIFYVMVYPGEEFIKDTTGEWQVVPK